MQPAKLRLENTRFVPRYFPTGLEVSVLQDGQVILMPIQLRQCMSMRPIKLFPEWWSRDRILKAINAEGVPCFTGSCGEIYLEKAFQDAGFAPASPLPIAHELDATSLCFLVHPTLDSSDMEKTLLAVHKVMAEAALLK